MANYTLDVRSFLTPSIAAKINDSLVPHPVYAGAYEALPPAWQPSAYTAQTAQATAQATAQETTPAGFPVIVFVHGTAGWRSQSLSLVSHWASRGFVVVAADYPGICLHDLLDAVDRPLSRHPRVDQVRRCRLLTASSHTPISLLNDQCYTSPESRSVIQRPTIPSPLPWLSLWLSLSPFFSIVHLSNQQLTKGRGHAPSL